MQKMIKITIISFVFSLVFLLPLGLSADPPGMPGSHGTNGDQAPPGGGAPIGGGIAMLIAMSAAYGSKKLYQLKQSE